jgi:hypothetical protein
VIDSRVTVELMREHYGFSDEDFKEVTRIRKTIAAEDSAGNFV